MTKSTGRQYAGMSSDERDARRRARLLDATRELVGTIGYAATTIERICSTANVSTRHFYLQYANKEAALVDLYDSLTSESLQKVLASWRETEGRPISERVSAALMAYLGPMFSDPQIARIAFVEVIGVSPRLERIRLDYRESLVDFIQQEGSAAAARGEAADRDFRFAALALIGAANVIVHDWAAHEDRPPAAEVERNLSDLAVTLITASS